MDVNMLISANNNLHKLADIINGNKDAFDSMDLKLHDINWYLFKDMETEFPELVEDGNDYFNYFCEDSYNFMIEDFHNDYMEFQPDYIGRTSKFFLSKEYKLNDNNNLDAFLETLIYNIGYQSNIMPELLNVSIVVDDWIRQDDTNIDYIASEVFIEDATKEIQPIIDMYNYISGFKADQVEIFKDFLNSIQIEKDYIKEMQAEHDLEVWLSGVDKIIG